MVYAVYGYVGYHCRHAYTFTRHTYLSTYTCICVCAAVQTDMLAAACLPVVCSAVFENSPGILFIDLLNLFETHLQIIFYKVNADMSCYTFSTSGSGDGRNGAMDEMVCDGATVNGSSNGRSRSSSSRIARCGNDDATKMYRNALAMMYEGNFLPCYYSQFIEPNIHLRVDLRRYQILKWMCVYLWRWSVYYIRINVSIREFKKGSTGRRKRERERDRKGNSTVQRKNADIVKWWGT